MVGDDPSAKSSTLPSASESVLESLHVPTFYPGNVQEVLDLGLHAWACSRASGLWTALKIVTSVADGAGTAQVAPDRVAPVLPVVEWEGRPFEYTPNGNMLAPASLEMERTLLGPRTETALAYARENGVNPIERFGSDAWLGLVAAGKGYHDLRQALADMGLDDRALGRAGVRILHPGMIWPLDANAVEEFAAGLEEIVVVEEKRPFLERQVKEILYGAPGAPRVLGKADQRGAGCCRPRASSMLMRSRAPSARGCCAARGSSRSRRACASWPTRRRGRCRCRWRPARRSSAPAALTTARRPPPRGPSSAPGSAATR